AGRWAARHVVPCHTARADVAGRHPLPLPVLQPPPLLGLVVLLAADEVLEHRLPVAPRAVQADPSQGALDLAAKVAGPHGSPAFARRLCASSRFGGMMVTRTPASTARRHMSPVPVGWLPGLRSAYVNASTTSGCSASSWRWLRRGPAPGHGPSSAWSTG